MELNENESQVKKKDEEVAVKKAAGRRGSGNDSKRRQRPCVVDSTDDENAGNFSGGNIIAQPKCLSDGCVLQPHQIDSLKWMSILYENKINGILADDMGMGKTI